MNKTIICASLTRQKDIIKKLNIPGSVIDIRQFVSIRLEEIHRQLAQSSKLHASRRASKAKSSKKIIFLYFDLLFPLGVMPLLNLERLQEEHPGLDFIFIINSNPYDPSVYPRLKKSTLLFENIIYMPVNWHTVSDYSLFLDNFSEAEKRILRLAVRGETVFQATLQRSLDYLVNTAVLVKKRGQYQSIHPKLTQAALEVNGLAGVKFELAHGQIRLDQQTITSQFSHHQQVLLRSILEKPGKVVTRDTLAKKLWGKRWYDKYSDWYLDQLAYSTRKKLKKLWVDPKTIMTDKKAGFRLAVS